MSATPTSPSDPTSNTSSTTSQLERHYRAINPQLPLAVYRELAAHLQQVDRVQTTLIEQSASTFDYALSQIESINIWHPQDLSAENQQLIQEILSYYGDRFGSWQIQELT
jgi:hypothetical protein